MANRKSRILSLPLYLQILIGMLLGIAIGFIALKTDNTRLVQNWIVPWGQIFIRLLQMIAIPLIFVSLVKGVTGLKDISKFSKMGGKTVVIYLATTIVAVVLGLGMGLIVKPGEMVDKSQIAHIQEKYTSTIEDKAISAELAKEEGPLNFLNDIVPQNIVAATSSNSGMLQVIFFAVFFALAALTLKPEKIKTVADFFDGLNEIILRMVHYIIKAAPLGVTALMAGLVTDFKGDGSVFAALIAYSVTVIVGLLILILLFYPALIHFFTKIGAKKFIKAMYPVQLFAFTTSSSAVTLPLNMETVENELKVSRETTSFVLPVGATINMDGTSCYQTIAVLFISQVLGIDLGLQELLTIIAMTILSSIGTPSIPGGSYVIMAMVLTSVGIPAEGLALIIGVDRPLDMLRTAVNVTGDAVIASIVDKK